MDAITATTVAKSQEPRNIQPKTAEASHAVRKNLSYLYDPKNKDHRPSRFRTRAGLQTLRYVLTFAFWRITRMIKYAVVGSIVAAVAGSVLGPFISGAAFLVAPTGIIGFAGAGLLWGLAKFGWRTLAWRIRHNKTSKASARQDERVDAGAHAGEHIRTRMKT